MEITIQSAAGDFHYNPVPHSDRLNIVGSAALSGDHAEGITPMALLLHAYAGCMSIDVEMILAKQKQRVDQLQIRVEAERNDGVPKYFTKLVTHVNVVGKVNLAKLEKAVQLSADKYCSVKHSLREDIEFEFVCNVSAV